jgi:hypothetical protein
MTSSDFVPVEFNKMCGMIYELHGKVYLRPYVNQAILRISMAGRNFLTDFNEWPVLNFKKICPTG